MGARVGVHVHKDVLTDNVFLYENMINHRSYTHHCESWHRSFKRSCYVGYHV